MITSSHDLLLSAHSHTDMSKPDILSSATIVAQKPSIPELGLLDAAESSYSTSVSGATKAASPRSHTVRVPEHATAQAMRLVADRIEKYSPEFVRQTMHDPSFKESIADLRAASKSIIATNGESASVDSAKQTATDTADAFSEHAMKLRVNTAPLIAQYDQYHAGYGELSETAKTYAKCYATIAAAVQHTTVDKPMMNLFGHFSDLAAAFGDAHEAQHRVHASPLKRLPSDNLDKLYGRYADSRRFTGPAHANSMVS